MDFGNTTLGAQVEVNTLGHETITNVQKCFPGAEHATPALYDHKVVHCKSLEVEPDVYVQFQAHRTREESAMMYLQRQHKLKLPRRISTRTVKTTAVLQLFLAVCPPHGKMALSAVSIAEIILRLMLKKPL